MLYTPIKSINAEYIYDANTNCILPISETLYEALLSKASMPEAATMEFNKLQKNGFLAKKSIEKIEHPQTSTIQNSLENFVEQLTLQVTQGCNLVCGYCPYSSTNTNQRGHTNQTMSKELAIEAIDFYYSVSRTIDPIIIGFYGGEPLLNFKLIKYVVEYTKKKFWGKKVKFTITTNATILSPAIFKYLVENDFQILLSIDGPEKIHDSERKFTNGKGSFRKIESNLNYLIEEYGKEVLDKFSLNMVINPSNDYEEIETFFENPLFKEIQFTTNIVEDDFSDNETVFSDVFIEKDEYNKFLSLLNYFKIVETPYSPLANTFIGAIENEFKLFRSKHQEIPDTFAPGGPCIPGQRRLFVNIYGDMYPCEKVSETSELTKIGSVRNGFNFEKAEFILNSGQFQSGKCKSCWGILHCGHCIKTYENNGILDKHRKAKACKDSLEASRFVIALMILESEIKNFYTDQVKDSRSSLGKKRGTNDVLNNN